MNSYTDAIEDCYAVMRRAYVEGMRAIRTGELRRGSELIGLAADAMAAVRIFRAR